MTKTIAHITIATPSLGQPANLLDGLDMLSGNRVAFCSPPKAPLRQFPVEVAAPGKGSWQPVCVSLHRDAESVLGRIIPFRVQTLLAEEPGFRLEPARFFNMTPAQQLAWTEAFLGIEPEEGCRYMLLELNRTDESAQHEIAANPTRRSFDRNWYLSDSWRVDSTKLRPGKRIHEEFEQDAVIPTEKAKEYLAAFYAYGTHVVSALALGDKLFQVVILKAEVSEMVVDFWRQLGNGQPVSGPDAQAFGLFLGPDYAAKVGPVRSLANDPALSASIQNGIWDDPGSLTGRSLMAVARGGDLQGKMLADFSAVIATTITLVSQARFLGFYRARHFERILRGALIQRWGELVELPIRRMPGIQNSLKADVLRDAFAARANDQLFLYGEQLRQADWTYLGDGETSALTCHRRVGFRGAFREVALRNSIMMAQLMDAGPTSGQASRLRVPDAAFTQTVLVCQKMAGVLIIENESGTKKDTVLDGLRFTTEAPESPWLKPRMAICGDLHSLDQDQVNRLLPCIQNALACIAATLGNPDTDTEQRAEAASFAEWLASLLAQNASSTVRQIRLEALYLARIGPVVLDHPIGLDFSANAAICTQYREIANAAMSFAETCGAHDDLNLESVRAFRSSEIIADNRFEKLLYHERQVSESCCSMLERLGQAYAQVVAEAVEDFQKSRLLLSEKLHASDSISGNKLQEADLILATMAASTDPASYRRPTEIPDNQDGAEIQGIALEFISVESCALRQFKQVEALERLCDLLNMNATPAPDDLELALTSIAPYPEQVWQRASAHSIDLKRVISTTIEPGATEKKWLDELLLAWTQFETSRHRLLSARLSLCMAQLERRAHALFPVNHQPGTTGDVMQQQLLRLRILSNLGRALRQQALTLGALGLEKPGALAYFEPAAVAYLLQQQYEKLARHLGKTTLTHTSAFVYD